MCAFKEVSVDHTPSELIDFIRASSRLMVRELGFMRATLAATDYSASAVHALVEIGQRGAVTAVELAEILGLEKSSVSRMLRKLIICGELEETADATDGRAKLIVLTVQGRQTLNNITTFARRQVATALAPLAQAQRQVVGHGLATYAHALRALRLGEAAPPLVVIESGYRPGVVGRVVAMHATYYAAHAGFGQPFESQVAAGLADLVGRLDNPGNGLWAAVCDGLIVGAIAIDGEDLGTGDAHLRYFIVDDTVRGTGVGRRLLAEALRFCDAAGFPATRLWTFKGLDAARSLYESRGFRLESEQDGATWGRMVREQCFVRQCLEPPLLPGPAEADLH
jgi:DNA-binding MarR family transcriptional regulator/GNAT superfamily N-acetyltransferase